MDNKLKNVDTDDAENIILLTDRIVKAVNPLRIYLFGSFADGTYNKDSDFDFYILVNDCDDRREKGIRARMAIGDKQKRPVDIIVGTKTRFFEYGVKADTLFIEREVFRKGIIVYDAIEGDIAV